MESSTSITFTLTEAKKLTLVFVESTSNIKLNGEKLESGTNIIVIDLEPGSYTITKADTKNLFYIILE